VNRELAPVSSNDRMHFFRCPRPSSAHTTSAPLSMYGWKGRGWTGTTVAVYVEALVGADTAEPAFTDVATLLVRVPTPAVRNRHKSRKTERE
jgi:hypothetical protein